MRMLGRFIGVTTLLVALVGLTAVLSRAASATEPAQRTFASPEQARDALVAAVQQKDRNALAPIFGPALRELETGDPVEDATEFEHFSRHVLEGTELARVGENKDVLLIGAQKWPFPMPIVHSGNGWLFDTRAGRDEILNRRIGHNELTAINVCLAYVQAQREYYNMQVQEGDQLPKYAQHLVSSRGKKDGLYWQTLPGEKQSPLGPLVAKAKEQGYMQPRAPGQHGPRPFHGYYFKILKKQQKSAPGGKFDYVINGNMVAGHALVAYPSRWGVSGVMTFIVNQSGRVYEKNLGPKTEKIARKMQAYDPDPSWKLVDTLNAQNQALKP
jgi:hypothetical protein